nr:zincin-like metallopeptidase toxin domain-containing protein [Paenibacillus xylanexedens]
MYATDGSTASAYEYDARNRLVKAGKLKYRYNPQGDRIELAQRGQVTRYVIDDAPELSRVLMELDGEGNVKARYVYGLGLIGREDADGTYLSYHYDLRGSTTLLTDEQNRVKDRYTYGLYGELEQHEGVTVQPFAYNGRDGVMTDANGLYYMRARYYDPKLKRFLNRDVIRGEIQDGQTFNRYAYVNGNPVSYIDPLGLMKCETGGTGKDGNGANGTYDYRKVNKQTNSIGETYATRKEVKQFKKKWEQSGIPVIVDKKGKILIGDYQAAFDYGGGKIFIKKNPTVVNLYHEGYHAEQWLDIGKDAYMKLSRLEREEHVFEQIMKNQHLFDDASIKHSIEYINSLRLKFK